MEIDEIDGNEGHHGHIYRIKKIDEIQEILIAKRERERYINETNFVQHIIEELILLV